MRKNIFWRLLGGFGKGEVRIHQSKKREIVFSGLSHTRVQAGTGERIYINILCAFGEKREVWRKLVFRWYWCSLRKMSSVKFLIVYSSGEIFCVWQTELWLSLPCQEHESMAFPGCASELWVGNVLTWLQGSPCVCRGFSSWGTAWRAEQEWLLAL